MVAAMLASSLPQAASPIGTVAASSAALPMPPPSQRASSGALWSDTHGFAPPTREMEEISCVSLAVTLQTRTVLGPGQDQSHHHHVVDDEVDSDGGRGLIPSHYIYIWY